MISRPVIGMRVKVINHHKGQETVDGVLTCKYDISLGPLVGTITDIWKGKPRGHAPKIYTVTFDPPNFGRILLEGTKDMEVYHDATN